MGKYCLLAMTSLLAGELMMADTLANLPGTTMNLAVTGGGCLETFNGAGDNFLVSGMSGNVCDFPWLAQIGLPLDPSEGFTPGSSLSLNGGLITLDGAQYSVAFLSGAIQVTPNGSLPIVPNLSTGESAVLTVPARATGSLQVGCWPAGPPPFCSPEFNPLANLTFDLPGVITINISSIPIENADRINSEQFESTPEPATFWLLAVGAMTFLSERRFLRFWLRR